MDDAALAKWLREELPRAGPRIAVYAVSEYNQTVEVIIALLALMGKVDAASEALVLDDYYCQQSPEEVGRWIGVMARLRAVLPEGR